MSTLKDQLNILFDQLTEAKQEELVNYALFQVQQSVHTKAEGQRVVFYINPQTFEVYETLTAENAHALVPCYECDIENMRPLRDEQGHISSRAPRWFLEATGQLTESDA